MRDSRKDSLELRLTELSKLDKRHCVPLQYATSLLSSITPPPAFVGVGSRLLAVLVIKIIETVVKNSKNLI